MQDKEKKYNFKWDESPNSKIKENLIQLGLEHSAIKTEVDKLLIRLINIETEYNIGNLELIKRNKGVNI